MYSGFVQLLWGNSRWSDQLHQSVVLMKLISSSRLKCWNIECVNINMLSVIRKLDSDFSFDSLEMLKWETSVLCSAAVHQLAWNTFVVLPIDSSHVNYLLFQSIFIFPPFSNLSNSNCKRVVHVLNILTFELLIDRSWLTTTCDLTFQRRNWFEQHLIS